MLMRFRKTVRSLLPAVALFALAPAAFANTLNQNVSWTIDRAGTTTKYRVVAYGDSIYAGYNGSTLNAAKYSAPTVEAEYLSAAWGADIESVRRAKSGAAAIASFEKNEDVLWLRTLNPWSPDPAASGGRLSLAQADVAQAITTLPDASFEVALHDPPRFGIAGELYARSFYDQLARVLRPGARLFHYTGSPNKLTSGRDVPGEVARRLVAAGFRAERALDGVLAIRR